MTAALPPGEDLHGIGGRVAKGAAWMIALRMTMRGLGLISLFVLARLVTPEDFGLVALATTFLAAVELLTELQPAFAIIQNTRAERRHYDTAWTITVIRGALMGLVLVLLAAPCAVWFDEPRLEAMLYWLALATFIGGFDNIGILNFYRDLTFHKEFYFRFISKIFSFIVTILAAFYFRNYWALITGLIASRCAELSLSYVVHAYRPRFSLSAWREIFGYSKWVLVESILRFLSLRSDAFFIAKWLGPTPLGVYAVAKRISEVVGVEIAAPMRISLFPGYAKMAEDPNRLRRNFLDSFALIVLIGAPAAVGVALCAEPFVTVALGTGWEGCVPVLQVLAIDSFAIVASANGHALFLALGKPNYVTIAQAVRTTLVIPLVAFGVLHAGLEGAALALAVAGIASFIVNLVLVDRVLAVAAGDLVRAVWRTIAASAAMAAAVFALEAAWPGGGGTAMSAARLAAAVTVGAGVFGITVLMLWWLAGFPAGAEGHVVSSLRARFRRLPAAAE